VADKNSSNTGKRRSKRRQTDGCSQHVISLLTQRDDLMNEIVAMRVRKRAPSPFIRKAGTLLTRFWARADWKSRAEILQSARWLVDVGRMQSAMAPVSMQKTQVRKRRRAAKSAAPLAPSSLLVL
jgi:hypothetical protein